MHVHILCVCSVNGLIEASFIELLLTTALNAVALYIPLTGAVPYTDTVSECLALSLDMDI